MDWIFYGEPYPYRASLSYVRVIVMFMRVFVELLCQVVMVRILALDSLLASAHGVPSVCGLG
jgi:hypothetical protein